MLCAAFKLYKQILEQGRTRTGERTLSEAQSRFRKGRSVQDHIFSVKQIIEKTHLNRTTAYVAFIDMEKAFDTANRQKVRDIPTEREVNMKL